jgi:cyclohexa-1,5-dienecarbonyl-CoA hydratase
MHEDIALASFDIIITNRIVELRLNAPPRNILTAELQSRLAAEFTRLRSLRDHNVVVLTTALPDFSAGADVSEHIGRDNCERMLKSAHELIAAILRHPVPVVVCVRGHCLGGAFELALACDHVVAHEDSRMGLPEITLGCYPPAALVLAPMKLPASLAAELVLSGRVFTARELAPQAGWHITPDLEAATSEILSRYAALPREPLEEATRLMRCGAAERFEAAIGGIERDYLDRLLAMPDAQEGPRAFLEKRPPRWQHNQAS